MKRKEKLKEGEIIPLTFDYVFTSIFNDEKNIAVLENFIVCYFDEPLEKINIELSNRVGEGIINRNLVYACNIHGGQLEYGDNTYSNIKKTRV